MSGNYKGFHFKTILSNSTVLYSQFSAVLKNIKTTQRKLKKKTSLMKLLSDELHQTSVVKEKR